MRNAQQLKKRAVIREKMEIYYKAIDGVNERVWECQTKYAQDKGFIPPPPDLLALYKERDGYYRQLDRLTADYLAVPKST